MENEFLWKPGQVSGTDKQLEFSFNGLPNDYDSCTHHSGDQAPPVCPRCAKPAPHGGLYKFDPPWRGRLGNSNYTHIPATHLLMCYPCHEDVLKGVDIQAKKLAEAERRIEALERKARLR